MNKKTVLGYILLLLLVFPAYPRAQQKNEDLIPWTADRKLSWVDYKSKPDPASDAAATTTSYLGIDYNFKNGKITYTIACSFSKNRSWGRYQTDYILSHEQGHFDISEIFARSLNEAMSKYVFNKITYQQDLKKIYDDVLAEKEIMQNQYDDETDFSRNKEQQSVWLKKIRNKLDQLNSFSNYK